MKNVSRLQRSQGFADAGMKLGNLETLKPEFFREVDMKT
jgi:hypothetical protein